MKHNNNLTHEEVKEYFDYDPKTGKFFWAKAPWRHKYLLGKEISCVNSSGYVVVHFKRHMYYIHRLIWLWMTGSWPKQFIDHINCIKTDNKWGNLREATASENKKNIKAFRNNSSGYKGIHWDKRNKKWYVHINLGYADLNNAIKIYNEIALKYHGEYAKLNEVE